MTDFVNTVNVETDKAVDIKILPVEAPKPEVEKKDEVPFDV